MVFVPRFVQRLLSEVENFPKFWVPINLKLLIIPIVVTSNI